MKLIRVASLLLLLTGLTVSLPVMAQSNSTPRWIDQDESTLDKERYNETYQFKVFNTYDLDVNKLRKERFKPLYSYLAEEYQSKANEMSVDSLYLEGDTIVTYCITLPTEKGESVIYAQRIDEYYSFEDYESGAFQFEYYQLYAVSTRLDTIPDFDDFKVSKVYNSKAVVLSIIPGMGQVYKGQKLKGFTILGAEATLIVASIAFNAKKHKYSNYAKDGVYNVDSWKSKSSSWRRMRDVSLVAGGVLYIYNLIDAAKSRGNRHLIVNKPQDQGLSIVPAIYTDGIGASFVLSF